MFRVEGQAARGPRAKPLLREMVAERTKRRLDPRLVADAGVVFVKLQNQVGLPVPVQNPPEIFDGERIRTALEGGHKHRIQPLAPRGEMRRPEDLRRIVPVEAFQERCDLVRILFVVRQHVLEEDFDVKIAEKIRDSLVHRLLQHRVGPSEKDNADILLRPAFPFVDSLQLSPRFAVKGLSRLIGMKNLPVARGQEGLQGHEQFDLRLEETAVHHGHDDAVPPLRASHARGKGSRILGVITVIPVCADVFIPRLGVGRQEDEVAPVGEMLHVAEKGVHGSAEFGPGELPAGLDRVLEILARDDLHAQRIEEPLPEGHLLGQIEGVRDADLHRVRNRIRPRSRPEDFLPFLQEVVLLSRRPHVFLRVVIAAAEEAESHRLAPHGDLVDLAVVLAQPADLMLNGNVFSMQRQPPKR